MAERHNELPSAPQGSQLLLPSQALPALPSALPLPLPVPVTKLLCYLHYKAAPSAQLSGLYLARRHRTACEMH